MSTHVGKSQHDESLSVVMQRTHIYRAQDSRTGHFHISLTDISFQSAVAPLQLSLCNSFVTAVVSRLVDWPYRQGLPYSMWSHGPGVGHRLVSS